MMKLRTVIEKGGTCKPPAFPFWFFVCVLRSSPVEGVTVMVIRVGGDGGGGGQKNKKELS